MNILMLSQFYPPIMGGIERHIQSLSQALVKKGHQVSVATLWHKGLAEFEEQDGVNIYRVHGTMQRMASLFTTDRQHAPPFPDPEVTLALRRVITTVRPQIVHGHDWLVRSFLPIKSWSRAKLVRTLHDCELTCVQMRFMFKDGELCSGPSAGKCLACAMHHYGPAKGSVTFSSNRFMEPAERKLVDMYLPVSQAVAQVNRLDSNQPQVRVVPNFILDRVAESANPTDPALEQLPTQEFILQVGDLVPDKGVEVLFKAYSGLDGAPPLVLIGRRLPSSPQKIPVGVIILESMPHAAVMQAWNRSMFGTVPSTCMDASPTVTLEAMACGRPVIGSRIGGIVDQIVDSETGFLVTPGDADALRQAMARLIADPELRKRMGEAAKERVREFQASTVVSKIEAIYQTLCAC
jgi:glycosyltransferase involved in cell wall biosynthesis